MSIDFKRPVVTNNNLPKLFSAWTQYLKIDEPYSLFNDMSNNDIKEQTFGEKIYQLDHFGFTTMGLKTSLKDNKLILTSDFDNHTSIIEFGYVTIDTNVKEELSKNYYLTLVPSGGKYKQVITNNDGVQTVKQFFEPIKLELEFGTEKPVKKIIDTTKSKNDNITPQEIQKRVANGQKDADNDQALGGCLITVGIIGGLGFLIFGHPLIAIIFFVICFSGSVYSLTPH